MSALLRIEAVFVVAVKRLFSQRGLALAIMLGLVTAVALTMSIPLYTDAVYNRVLLEEVSAQEKTARRPPFAFMFSYIGAWSKPVTWEKVQAVDQYLSTETSQALGLPRKLLVRHFTTDNFKLFPQSNTAYASTKDPLAWVNFAFTQDLEKHITLVEGRFPSVAPASPESPVEALMSESLALTLGARAGEDYITFVRRATTKGEQAYQIPVRVVGIWKPTDSQESYWFWAPTSLEDLLMVPEGTLVGRLNPTLDNAVYLAVWYLIMDGTNVRSGDALSLLGRINGVMQRADTLLPATQLTVSPAEALQKYRQIAGQLTLMLYVFSIPIMGLLLAFIGLVVGLSVGRRRNEIAVLRSRGATTLQVVGIAALEALLLGALALVLGIPFSHLIALIIGKTRSFLDFSAPSNLHPGLTQAVLQFGLVMVGLTILAQVMPTISAARHTIVTYKQERARTLQPPWWQRAWLDVLLLIPAAYGAYLLRKQGSIVLPLADKAISQDLFQNPLLFLVPALGIFALALFIVRILPHVMAALAWLASHTPSVGLLLAARQLARTPGFYTAPMVLLVVTLSLSTFTASLAQTLDRHLYDQTYYQTGADISLSDSGESTEMPGMVGGMTGGSKTVAPSDQDSGPRWLFRPVSDYLSLPGVQAVTRIGRVTAQSEETKPGTLIGVDRVDVPGVGYWRRDFALTSLGALMNNLAVVPDGVLASNSFLKQQGRAVGDTLPLQVSVYGQSIKLDLKIAGSFDLFPTWYPEDDGPLFVVNLDYLFEQAGGLFPYHVWIRSSPNVNYVQFREAVDKLNVRTSSLNIARQEIVDEQRRPERQGLFGVLSVGFGAAALLTVLSFLLYALFSFRSRFIELGVLRAIGLSAGQMTMFLAWELAFLLLVGLAAGTGLGVWASKLFIPYLQVGAKATDLIPPYVVEIAWPELFRIYILFGLLFVVALGTLAALLMRMQIFQAVKLGETT
jgi:putative ABC transport system permease protein